MCRTNANQAEKELGRLRREVRHLLNELGRKGDDIKALTIKATQLKSTFNKKQANAEGRVEKYKTEAKDAARRMESLKSRQRRELKWELQLKLSNKEALNAASDRDTVKAKLAEFVEERRERIDVRESGVRGNPVNDKFARHVRGLLTSGASAAATSKQLSLNSRFFLNARRGLQSLRARYAENSVVSISTGRAGA